MTRREDPVMRGAPGNSDCFICHGLGKVLDRRETRVTGFSVYADCACTGIIRGWEKVVTTDRLLREQALARFNKDAGQ